MTAARLALTTIVLTLGGAGSAHAQLVEVDRFKLPTYATAAPGDYHRFYVTQKGGAIVAHHFDHDHGETFLDLSEMVSVDSERGLLSMAFAPDFQTSRRFYVYYTDRDGDIRIDEFRAATPDAADPASRRSIAVIEHSEKKFHNGGGLVFRGDALYASIGDAGQPSSVQDPSLPYGKILRIAPETGATSVVALGLRNPWRFSFHPDTGDLIVTDVGQDAREEINVIAPGEPAAVNLGWPCYEGTAPYRRSTSCDPPDHRPPVLEKLHANGYCSITGGYVVRDPQSPLRGRYVYGDYCSATLRTVVLSATGASDDRPTDMMVPSLASFGEDNCGRVYAISHRGPLYRVGDSSCSSPPEEATSPVAPPAGAPTTDIVPPTRALARALARGRRSGPRISVARSAILTVRYAQTQRVRRRGRLAVSASCTRACGLVASGRITVGRRAFVLQRVTVRRARARASVRLELAVPSAARRAARRARARVVATVAVRTADDRGSIRRRIRVLGLHH